MTGLHKFNKILMDPGIIRHLRVKCQPDLVLILGCYDVSVYFGQNRYGVCVCHICIICIFNICNIRRPDKNHRIVFD